MTSLPRVAQSATSHGPRRKTIATMLRSSLAAHRIPAFLGAALSVWCWLGTSSSILAQGCVAHRGGGQCSLLGSSLGQEGYLKAGEWLLTTSYRWAYSDTHFIRDQEFTLPNLLQAEAINNSHNVDVSILHAVTPRLNIGLILPFSYATRSTKYEHDAVNRHETSAGGLGDIRLMAYWWLWDPGKSSKGNISLGIGPKFPTGDYRATDTFYTSSGPVRREVDPSIQPGDGGFGLSLELFSFLEISERVSAYAQGSYLFNPRNTNGVPVYGGPAGGNPVLPVTSVADQFSARAGFSYTPVPAWGLAVTLGPRIDGVPARDAFGASDGFRRPGTTLSIEPGITWTKDGWSVSVTAPVALYRNRPRSTEDIEISAQRGIYQAGDAAFADYFITASISRKF